MMSGINFGPNHGTFNENPIATTLLVYAPAFSAQTSTYNFHGRHGDYSMGTLWEYYSDCEWKNDELTPLSRCRLFYIPLAALLNRHRAAGTSSPPTEGAAAAGAAEIQRVVEEQAATIESLKKDKTLLETSLGKLQTDHDRVIKENHVLRKAFQIQQERQSHAEQELETAKQYKAGAEEQIKKLDQIILSLRYHLQAQQHNNSTNNDFMGLSSHRPPDVY
jgi:hypothetical protein